MTLSKAALFTVVGSVSVFSIFIKMYHSLVGKKEQNTKESSKWMYSATCKTLRLIELNGFEPLEVTK